MMRNKFILTVLFFASVFAHVNAADSDKNKPDVAEPKSFTRTLRPDSIDLDCILDFNFNPEGLRRHIDKVNLILNDSVALIKTISIGHSDNPTATVSLKKMTADCLRLFLYDLYSTHSSVIKDKYLNESHYIFSNSSIWHIDLTLNGKRIDESLNIYDYMVSFEDPFNFQFDRIRQLMYAITNKIERDILQQNNVTPEAAEWIKEMFHDVFYH